ncbi:rod shape-determining protein RodA [Roseovarius atlanticus]|uniref:Rod shape-determining protein RodA n=1 Tax=Roseovarius atlanticus TaxID=1641875 RepID=A0A0T5NUE2_9RHOB|nr:rod shape-determining protein RodA [Roseovarius atlanticus]
MKLFTKTAAALALTASMAFAQSTPAPEGAEVYFVNLEDGATVSAPVKVVFGLSGMGVAPAGTEKENTGHHHILVDRAPLGEGPDGEEELQNALPADENHVHFGGGQTEVELDLEPGEHTLQLVLGDMNHVPHDPPVTSEQITITVE